MGNKKPACRRGRVIVAMSGGVDSSVAAAILKKNGYNVVGVFMKFWKEPGKERENLCCSAKSRMDAKRVAIKLNIPFYVLNVQKEFKKRVVDHFISEYKNGRTPNPCVECNRWIKFKFLIEKALQLKADFVATGHYARIKKGKLFTAKDTKKDQTYFLWQLSHKQISKVLFPIGDYTKTEVRTMAKKFNLPVFEKNDSQEICFINTGIQDFLNRNIKAKSGDIITIEGKKIDRHKGLAFYTIGQRKGLPATGKPIYVVKKDLKRNALIVSQSEKYLLRKEMIVKNVNWLNKKPYTGKCKVKIRSMVYPPAQAEILRRCGRAKMAKIIFKKPQRAITSGQSAVFYKGNEVWGGGIIL